MTLNFDLKKYKSNIKVFVETGTLTGNAIDKALELNFDKIYSIELDTKRFNSLTLYYEDYDDLFLIHGNSEKEFPNIMNNINERCVIYLDAHYCGDDAEMADKWSPIRDELNYLKTHPIKNHTIILGDWSCHDNTHVDDVTGVPTGYIGKKNTIRKILKINPNYKLQEEKGSIDNDILVAYIEDNKIKNQVNNKSGKNKKKNKTKKK